MIVHRFCTEQKSMLDITAVVRQAVEDSGITDGICAVFTPHTTAGLTITSYHDPLGHEDIQDELSHLFPTKVDYKHQYDTPQDAAGHVKSALMGIDLCLLVEDGEPKLGLSQGVFFAEFDGPRKREVHIKVLGLHG